MILGWRPCEPLKRTWWTKLLLGIFDPWIKNHSSFFLNFLTTYPLNLQFTSIYPPNLIICTLPFKTHRVSQKFPLILILRNNGIFHFISYHNRLKISKNTLEYFILVSPFLLLLSQKKISSKIISFWVFN